MNTQTEFSPQDLGDLLLAYKDEIWGSDITFDFFSPEVKREILQDCQVAKKIFEKTFQTPKILFDKTI